jgi:hypothetical protein
MNQISDKYVTLSSPTVVNFYKLHPLIDPEIANTLLVDLLNGCLNNNKHMNVLQGEHIPISNDNNTLNMPFKDSLSSCISGENKLENILNKLNPTHEVIKSIEGSCDFIIKNAHNSDIFIENKIMDINVSNTAVNMFMDTCKQHKVNGVFISQHSGIVGKKNLEIDYIGHNIIVYISNVNYNEDKIQIALDVIEKLFDKTKTLNLDDTVTIPIDTLNEIKQEYQQFTKTKEDLHDYIKNTHSQIINKMGNINLLTTGEFLSTQFTQVDIPKKHTCDLCKIYTSNTLKGIAAHKRGCKKKFGI